MDFEFLLPVQDAVLAHNQLLPKQSLAHTIKIHSQQTGLPDLKGAKIAIVGINETRNAVIQHINPLPVSKIRQQLYKLFPGNWGHTIIDLGNINQGATVQDTYFAVQSMCEFLLKEDIIPILIGGSQDVTYASYRAFDEIGNMVNLVSVDSRFDFGNADELISSQSYMSKIIVEKPNNLFNDVPNGFDSREICAITRYAGISEKVQLFGIFECHGKNYSAALIAQMVWYFIEGVNYRIEEVAIDEKGAYQKYIVPVDDEELHFYKSNKSGRWWIEIPFMINLNNKLKRHTLLPCTYSDYLDACNQKRPERWWKAFKKSIA